MNFFMSWICNFLRKNTNEYKATPFQHSKIRVLPPLAAPHGVSLARPVARWDVGRPVLLVLVRARELAQAQVQAPQRRVGYGPVIFVHGFPLKRRRLSWKKNTQRGD